MLLFNHYLIIIDWVLISFPVTGQESPVVDTSDTDPVDTESQLLELEFRARALKSLMQARQKVNT